jgi:hypothetical protein
MAADAATNAFVTGAARFIGTGYHFRYLTIEQGLQQVLGALYE